MIDPTGVRNVEEVVNPATFSTRHPALIFDVDEALRREPLRGDLRYVIGQHGDEDCNYYLEVGETQYKFQFVASGEGFLVTNTIVEDALRGTLVGDYDVITEIDPAVAGGDPWDHYYGTPYLQVTISLPRPHLSDAERAVALAPYQEYQAVQEIRRAELQRRREEQRAVRTKEMAAWDQIHAKALITLRSFLTPEQRRTMTRYHHFTVVGSEGGRYRIWTTGSVQGNVQWLGENGKPRGSMCAHLREQTQLPAPDHWLGQLLEIRADESRWVAIAHHMSGEIHPIMRAHWEAIGAATTPEVLPPPEPDGGTVPEEAVPGETMRRLIADLEAARAARS
jgi:hypothetical protein